MFTSLLVSQFQARRGPTKRMKAEEEKGIVLCGSPLTLWSPVANFSNGDTTTSLRQDAD